MVNKICKKCGDSHIKKYWKMRWKQRYKCCKCWYVFQNMWREHINNKLWSENTEHKQIYKELWEKYWKDIRTMRKILEKLAIKKYDIEPWETVLIIDIQHTFEDHFK